MTILLQGVARLPYCMSELVCGLLLNLLRSGHRSGPTAKHWYPVPRVVSLLQGDRVNRWLGLLLSEPIPSAREMEDPGKKQQEIRLELKRGDRVRAQIAVPKKT